MKRYLRFAILDIRYQIVLTVLKTGRGHASLTVQLSRSSKVFILLKALLHQNILILRSCLKALNSRYNCLPPLNCNKLRYLSRNRGTISLYLTQNNSYFIIRPFYTLMPLRHKPPPPQNTLCNYAT